MNTEISNEENLPQHPPPEQINVVRFSKPVVALLVILSIGFPIFLVFFLLLYSQSNLENGLLFLLTGYISGICFFLAIFPKIWPLRFILIVIYTIAFLPIVKHLVGGITPG